MIMGLLIPPAFHLHSDQQRLHSVYPALILAYMVKRLTYQKTTKWLIKSAITSRSQFQVLNIYFDYYYMVKVFYSNSCDFRKFEVVGACNSHSSFGCRKSSNH